MKDILVIGGGKIGQVVGDLLAKASPTAPGGASARRASASTRWSSMCRTPSRCATRCAAASRC